jgi:prolyl 4-hydroxylase
MKARRERSAPGFFLVRRGRGNAWSRVSGGERSRGVSEGGAAWRAQIGEEVRARLIVDPAALQIPCAVLDLFVVRDFLNARETEALCRLIDAERIPSQLLSPSEDPEFRTSESCNLDPEAPIVLQVEAKIAQLTGIDPALGETIQGQRYAVGQQFKPHHDFFYESEAYWSVMEETGGQRTWTGMVFLNVPEMGGQTAFPSAGVKVTPRPGNLLLWNNMDKDGEPNLYSLHQGMPVEAGTKYVITKWYRERPWHSAPVPTYTSR